MKKIVLAVLLFSFLNASDFICTEEQIQDMIKSSKYWVVVSDSDAIIKKPKIVGKGIATVWIINFDRIGNDRENVGYSKNLFKIDFEGEAIGRVATARYDCNGNLVGQIYNAKKDNWNYVIPETIGESIMKTTKRLLGK